MNFEEEGRVLGREGVWFVWREEFVMLFEEVWWFIGCVKFGRVQFEEEEDWFLVILD